MLNSPFLNSFTLHQTLERERAHGRLIQIDLCTYADRRPKLARLLSSYADRRPKLARLLNCFARKQLGKPKLDPKSGYYLSFKPMTQQRRGPSPLRCKKYWQFLKIFITPNDTAFDQLVQSSLANKRVYLPFCRMYASKLAKSD